MLQTFALPLGHGAIYIKYQRRDYNKVKFIRQYLFFSHFNKKTPRVGLEPTTPRLTAECSAIELSRNTFSAFSAHSKLHTWIFKPFRTINWSSLRPISDSQLNTLPCLHLCPIYLVVFKGSYKLIALGYLILGGASRLDAFSVYPFRTWLLCYAIGMTTDTPAVRPARSSRTKASSPQISSARAG